MIRLSDSLGWPLLPDIGSQVRLGADSKNLVAHYDALLASDSFSRAHVPEAVIHVGGRALSKRLEQFLGRSRPDPYVVVRENPFRLDPAHRVTHSIEADVVDFCAALGLAAAEDLPARDIAWTAGWREASEEVGRSLDEVLSGEPSEPFVARSVSRNVSPRPRARGCEQHARAGSRHVRGCRWLHPYPSRPTGARAVSTAPSPPRWASRAASKGRLRSSSGISRCCTTSTPSPCCGTCES